MSDPLDVLDETARSMLEHFTDAVVRWKRSMCIIDSLDGHPLPPVTDPRYFAPVDELSRALGLELMHWATDAAVSTEDCDVQIAAIRESYELALKVMTDIEQQHVDLLLEIRLLLGPSPWKSRLSERVLRERCRGIDIGPTLDELETADLIRRNDGSIVIGYW